MKDSNSGYRVRFVMDDDAQFEEINGETRPLTKEEYKGNEYQKDGHKVSYASYLLYYGNPDRHRYLGCELQVQCPTCHTFHTAGSLWNIDLMDDSPEYNHVKLDYWYSLGEVVAETRLGYLADVAKDLRGEHND